MEIKYIDGDPSKGIAYDWKRIRKEYRKLKIPAIYFDPLRVDPGRAGYYQALSVRSRGKTTETLLLGMIMYKLYGTIIHYIRTDRETITPKSLKDLFPTIIDNGYIEKITDGKYNSVEYYGKRWTYVQRDDTGNIIEKSPNHFCIALCLDDSDRLKSSYSCPKGDLIIFDEFIQLSGYGYNDFIRFSDMISTIFRKRTCGMVYMLSNTIDINSPWFDEFCIRQDVETMQPGENRYIESPEGTHIFIEIMSPDDTPQRQTVNKRFFGFPNPKLAAITGRGTWATDSFPHIPPNKEDPPRILHNKLFLRHAGKLVKLQLVQTDVGLCVYVRPATKTYKDSRIFVSGDIHDNREIYGFGAAGSSLQLIWRLYKANRFFYATNSDGNLLRSYIKAVKTRDKAAGL
jgi:hypothetical protein